MAGQAIVVEREIAGRTLRFETGRIARLANAAVMATYGGSTVLATVVRAEPRPGIDFFPLTVDYREKTAAAGKFPGGFRKREGAPNEKEILTMRMIDRPLRPLFPDGFIDEIQVQVWVMSHDGENDTDVLAGTAAAAALAISNAPFEGPSATVRVGRIHTDDGPRYVLNPTVSQLEYSDLDLVLAGHRDGVNMIEVGAAEVEDAAVLEAIRFGQDGIAQVLDMIDQLTAKAGQEKVVGELMLPPKEIVDKVKKHCEKAMMEARQIAGKTERGDRVREIGQKFLDEHFPLNEDGTMRQYKESEKARRFAGEALRTLEKKVTRRLIVEKGVRADGRGFRQIRPLQMEVGMFARTHGSAFFQRGETQSLVSCTLGTGKDEQIIDGLLPEYAKKFTLHYNFPPFCTGEAKRITGPGRREIGHGALAERSLLAILPSPEDFPYTIRLVSDITESNGSSSMASVCGGCLALMDAGVPILNTCAGISVGRFTDENDQNEIFVTDIIGEEDFFGDMDFKVSGTRLGITGIQLDLKARGLNVGQIEKIFEQARQGRLELIDAIEKCIPAPRAEISPLAPRLEQIRIDPEKIGKLIGPGGKTIRALQDKYGVDIDVDDDGTVIIASPNAQGVAGCKAEIEALCEEVKVGTIYEGKVVSTKDFGAFVELIPGTDGMCHISELADGYVEKVTDVVKVGDAVRVKVIHIDDQGRIKLSRKAVLVEEKKKKEEPVAAAE
ncbi:MAG: polyribonucleotide nucleotidyltransferase [Leptolyngbya sp. PLA3]|nr:MAG: polyribonucleotide nucleotidyltransferase [Cyanobacteria bacterium CYA]MCE7968231.1 polyribonucleotide nucleotidyltransferase [Leptolyngbya sp. PL-A3]